MHHFQVLERHDHLVLCLLQLFVLVLGVGAFIHLVSVIVVVIRGNHLLHAVATSLLPAFSAHVRLALQLLDVLNLSIVGKGIMLSLKHFRILCRLIFVGFRNSTRNVSNRHIYLKLI